ncbi:outer membrane protein OmpA-like peptidoglycan-associated protein [Leptospira meyeri]|uniref:Outer membrane protein OmpA-like peptidoglycan-associated protein n=1 Tax=Leptospira meyeri TaxID=29508 RepID=A0A4R8N036_LEPME|nr:OmpA family protein [Leptospira meyeri]EKJ86937.1 OmpA family protein [Leptospira meyeri serovar Hardjo str. Went 5]TDY73537.1 outer membrane protein OmpA-like peptidoglycan-associated protein [Leptospira meyeri]
MTFHRLVFYSFVTILPWATASADPIAKTSFQWKWKENQVLELNEYHDVFFRVGTKTVEREDKNRVVLKPKKCSTDSCLVNAWFDTYLRYGKTSGPFWKDKEFLSDFTLFRNGRYEVPNEFTMPNLRSFPSFPDAPVSVSDVWKLPAEESFDFNSERIRVKVIPEYTFQGIFPWSEGNYKGNCEKITYTYPIFYNKPDGEKMVPNVPYKIFGFASGTIFFNATRGVPEFKEVKLSYTFIYPNGTVQEANFHIKGVYFLRNQINAKDKESIREDILEDLIVGYTGNPNTNQNGEWANGKPKDPKSTGTIADQNKNLVGENLGRITDTGEIPAPEKNSDPEKLPITVRTSDDGIVFSLDSILFDFNDSKLKPEAETAVAKIAEILKKYPDREIRVSGHTDNIGKKEYNQKLSENRAKSVLHSLVDQHKMDEKHISFKGYADEVPIVPNDSEENRHKNRRVEITLVLD